MTASSSKSPASGSKNRVSAGAGSQSGAEGNGGYIDPWEQNQTGETSENEGGGFLAFGENGSNPFENNGFWLIVCAIGLAAVIALLVFTAYRLGQRKKGGLASGEEKGSENHEEIQAEEPGDKDGQKTRQEIKRRRMSPMSNKGEKAMELFKQGYNCAQAVFGAFCDETGFDFETAVMLASPFGGGMAGSGRSAGLFPGC